MYLVNKLKYETKHWQKLIFPATINWKEIELIAEEKSYLSTIGSVGVDSASVTIEIIVKDILTGLKTEFESSIITPEGDGRYTILAGKIENIGRCIVIAFDLEDELNLGD